MQGNARHMQLLVYFHLVVIRSGTDLKVKVKVISAESTPIYRVYSGQHGTKGRPVAQYENRSLIDIQM